MVTFKKFLVEKIVGNTGWVYHRTRDNPSKYDIVKYGIKPSSNQYAMYGRGLYCCYDFEEQIDSSMEEKYGEYILKGKVDLNGFAILDEDIYRVANPRGDFEKHLKDIGSALWDVNDNLPYTSKIAERIWKKCKQNGYNGIIFTGKNDGMVAVIWNRRNFIPFQYTHDDGENWIKLNPDIASIKRPHDTEYDKDSEKISAGKMLKELSSKEEIDSLVIPLEYDGVVILKNLKKCESIFAKNARGLNLPKLKISDNILGDKLLTLNLPQLQKSGNIGFNNMFKIDLPQLQTAGNISSSSATEINLPLLEKSKDIYAPELKELNLPQLKESEKIDVKLTSIINLPQLKIGWYINAPFAKKINLLQLESIMAINANNATELNLPELIKVDLTIEANNATEINLPKLKGISSGLLINKAEKLNLPLLQTCGNIEANNVTELNLPILQKSGNIYAHNMSEINLPQLQKTEGFLAFREATKLNLPKLKQSAGIRVENAIEINLPQLELCRYLHAPKAKELNLPFLKEVYDNGINANNATVINLPLFQTNRPIEIKASNAKKIIIQKNMVIKLKGVPGDCEIIHPEDTPQVKVDENTTFKKYLMLKK